MANLPTRSGASEELYVLADAIGAATGAAVAIEDLDQRVLAHSTLPDQPIDELRRQGILDRRVPHQPEQLDQYRQVMAATGVVRLPVLADDELPRAAVAIRAGQRPLGTIWAIEGERLIDDVGERAMLDGARLAALHMLRRRSAAELDLQAREEGLRAALNGRRTASEVRFELGLRGRQPLALLGFAPLSCPDASKDDLLARLTTAATRHWATVHSEASITTVGRTVYVVVPLDDTVTAFAAARRLGERAAAVLDLSVEPPLRAALSRITTNPEELPDLRAEVDDILRVTTTDADALSFATLRDAHARVLLAHVADELARRPQLRHPGIEAMLEHDRAQGTAFAASITAWLDAVGNVGQAATRLTIHPNTLKYRLRRAGELFDIDLDHPDDRLSCWLQLRAPR
jgi:hypothetical protein